MARNIGEKCKLPVRVVQAAKWLKTRVISGQQGEGLGALLPVPVDFRHDYIVARPKDSVIVQVPLFFRAFELFVKRNKGNHSCCQVLERNFTRRNIRLIYPSMGADPLTRRCVTRVNHYHQPSLAENHVKRPPRVIIHASLSVFLMQLHRLPISGQRCRSIGIHRLYTAQRSHSLTSTGERTLSRIARFRDSNNNHPLDLS